MRWARLFLLLVMPGFAWAEVVDIRSGEHGAFTRLVGDLPSRETDWSLSPTDVGRVLTLGLDDPEFRAAGVFERIDRRRLSDLKFHKGNVTLVLGCDCEISAFQFGTRSLVIDIADRPLEQVPVETPEPLPPKPAAQALATPKAVLPDADTSRLKKRLLGLSDHLPEDPKVTERRSQLVEAIARAASQGMVQAKTALLETESDAGSQGFRCPNHWLFPFPTWART
jgi:hypothetical protein